MSTLSDVAERAVNSGWQYIAGATVGVSLFGADWKALLTGTLVAVGSSVAKSGVAFYYTGTPSLIKAKADVAKVVAIAESPLVKPLIAEAVTKAEANPEVKKIETVVAPVVAPVVAAVEQSVTPPTGA